MSYMEMVEKIDSLPPLSDTALIVKKLYNEGAQNVDVKRLIKAIESDALLSANVLKMINSPLYGFSKQINSVTQAVTLFGTELIYGLVVSYSINTALIANLRPYGQSNETFNEICHMQSALVNEWYSKINLKVAQFLMPLALIMESGKLIMAREIVQSTSIKSFCQNLKSSSNISLYEDSYFKTTSYFLSGLLFEHWNFNPMYGAILKGLDYEHRDEQDLSEYRDVLDVVRTAINAKDIFSDASINEAAEMVKDMNLNAQEFKRVCENIRDVYKEKMK